MRGEAEQVESVGIFWLSGKDGAIDFRSGLKITALVALNTLSQKLSCLTGLGSCAALSLSRGVLL
ncbi:hypothetical protein [Thiorhodovibrio winogradskyi]|nr:hypothetical protein [Thiorhodovibrio winogradskyi]